MIDQNTVNRILGAARIEEVVGEFVSLRKRGVNYVGLCPFHDDKTPSFYVSPSKGICKCFSCGKGGNVVHFIMEHEQLSYYDALKWLARKYGIEVVERELTPEEEQLNNERESMFVVNEYARDYFTNVLFNSTDGRAVGLAYFQQRGLREETIKKFQLGYCAERRDDFSKLALSKGYKKDLLVKTGLSVAADNEALFDRYRGRVIFPVHTVSGKVVAFGGRILKKKENVGKYINSPESEIYHKSSELYGIYFAKQEIVRQNRCYLVEGYLDVISMHQAGICNVVASSGTALTHGQIRLIHRFTDNVTVLYDGDAAGIKASLRGINLLLEEGLNIKVVLLPDGEDPDSYAQSHSTSETMEYIRTHETDFIRFKTDILLKDCSDDPIGRANLIQDLVESISLIPNEIIRSEYIRQCSRLLETREDLLLKQVNLQRSRLIDRNRQKRELEYRQQQGQVSQAVTSGATGGLSHSSTSDAGASVLPENSRPEVRSSDRARQQASRVNPLEAYEKNLMRMLVRYGERPICENEDGSSVSVLEFIREDFERDQITLSTPIFRNLLEEAWQHRLDEGFVAERFFLQHRDSQVSLLAADLVTERYELSRIYLPDESENRNAVFHKKIEREDEMLDLLVPRLMDEYKFQLLKKSIEETLTKIKEASRTKDDEAVTRWMKVYQQQREIEKEFARHLGERIIKA